MPRPKKSTHAQAIEDRQPVGVAVQAIAEKIEDDELALLKKLKEKYKDQDEGARVPGKVVRGIKTAWTYKDMCEKFPIVDFVPRETIKVTWNGVMVQLYAGVEFHVPKPIYDLYNRRLAELDRKPNIPGVIVEIGAGPLPPDL